MECLEIFGEKDLKSISGYSGKCSGFGSPVSENIIYLDFLWTLTFFDQTPLKTSTSLM